MDVASLQPLAGGWSGQTFVSEVAGERSVVRIYPPGTARGHRGDRAHEVDAALLHLVRGLVPVPDVLEVRGADPATGAPALLVTSFLPGARGDELLPTLDERGQDTLGRQLGEVLATLGGIPMLRAGSFVDGDLTVADLPGPDGLPEWVGAHEPSLADFSRDELAGLREAAFEAQSLLDTVSRRCLVHSDLNLKNVLVDPQTLEVTGVVDWEFAHAGHPFSDLGNLLRLDRAPGYADAVLAAYTSRRGGDPRAALDLARAADLWALVDLAARHASVPQRASQNVPRNAPHHAPAADAHDLLRAIGRTRDLHAWPTGTG